MPSLWLAHEGRLPEDAPTQRLLANPDVAPKTRIAAPCRARSQCPRTRVPEQRSEGVRQRRDWGSFSDHLPESRLQSRTRTKCAPGRLWRDLVRSPCRGIRLPPSTPKPRRVIESDDVQRLAETVAIEYWAMVLVAAKFGLRFGECAGLQVRLAAELARHLRRRNLTALNADAWVFAARAGGPLRYSSFEPESG